MYIRKQTVFITIVSSRAYTILFFLLLPIVVLFTLPFRQGFTAGDCGDYLCAANQLNHGNWDILHNFYATRIGTYLPYALGMKLFGFGTWLTWLTTIELILLLVLVYLSLRKVNPSIALLSSILLGTAPIVLQYSSMAMGDIASTLCSNAVILIIFYFRFYIQKTKTNAIIWGIATAMAFFTAFLVKESVVFFVPFILFNYWQTRKDLPYRPYWKYTIVTLTMLLTLLLIAYWVKTGNPFYKIMAVENGPTASDCNYAGTGWPSILNRVTWQPFQFITENFTFSFLFLFATLQAFQYRSDSSAHEKFFQHYYMMSIAMWWFGSQGITAYNPVSLVHRVWLPILVPMSLNASFFISNLYNNRFSNVKHKIAFQSLVFLTLTITSLFFSFYKFQKLGIEMYSTFKSIAIGYLMFVVLIIPSVCTTKYKKMANVFLITSIIALLLKSEFEAIVWRSLNPKSTYSSQKETINSLLALNPRIILTDYWIAKDYYIYTGFEKQLPFIHYNDSCLFDNDTYLLLNKTTQTELVKNINETRTFTSAKNQIPDFVLNPYKFHFTLIIENETNQVFRYSKQQ